MRRHALEHAPRDLLAPRADLAGETDGLVPLTAFDDLFEPVEGAAADEQDVFGVDLNELLVGVLASALRRDVRDGSFEDLQQRLLHALARDVAGDRAVLAAAGDLVDLVDIDDAALGKIHVVVRRLDQTEQDVFDVLADVARLGQRRGVGDRERNAEALGERLREVGLTDAGRTDQKHVGLLQVDVVVGFGGTRFPVVFVFQFRVVRGDALIVIVDRDRQDFLRVVLPDHVLVEHLFDLLRLRHILRGECLGEAGDRLFVDQRLAILDAPVADVEPGARGDQKEDLILGPSAKRAAAASA